MQSVAKLDAIPDQEVVAVRIPILRGYLIAAAGYYALISFSHPFYEHGLVLVVLEGLALTAAVLSLYLWRRLARRPTSLTGLEVAALAVNALFLANVAAYQAVHFEAAKLVYFVLLALVFATTAPSPRVAYASAFAALISLFLMARDAPGDTVAQYGFIGVAGAFTALGMSTLMNGAVTRELRARVASEALNRKLEGELRENRRLKTEAQDLATAAQTASHVKTQFLETMSHEIRTPLNGVLGMAQAMGGDVLSDNQRDRLKVIQDSGRSLLQVINAILDVSQIEAGRMEIRRAPFDLGAVTDSLRQLYAGLAQDRGLTFSLDVAPQVRGWREGDETRFTQVLSNLMSNAIKFTDTGGVEVRISGDEAGLRGDVIDSGGGIPEDRRAQVFERFIQVDSSSTRRAGGSGLGLAICRELVTLMGGAIDWAGRPSGGTCFTFDVPFPAVPARSLRAGLARRDTVLPERRGARILIVDDNAINRTFWRRCLAPWGVLRMARTAPRPWRAGRPRPGCDPDDIHMPRMDGL
ncbi:ATP-binding protein, partial [Caulobacter sp. B11]|uniref:ATP-binding protein n=1 Tax=Caulobacter sp. B11 TaxID=2048899 RepID=UPI000C12C202